MTIYLDNLAATPIDPRVAKVHCEAMAVFPGNAHSAEHLAGADARDAIDGAADSLLAATGNAANDVLFTPGASAALWLAVEDAIIRAAGRPAKIVASAAEHPALLSVLRRAERSGRISLFLIAANDAGAPCLSALQKALERPVDLLCTMAANNEVGTISDLAAISSLAKQSGTRLLIDASQAAGKMAMTNVADADLVVVSGAKIYGPRRAGALIGELNSQARDLANDLFGSPDTPGAIALAFAMQLRASEYQGDEARIATMRDRLQSMLVSAVPGLRVNGDLHSRLAGSLHVSTPHLPGEAVVARLWGRVAISTGAACQSGVPGPSHVLSSMGLPEWAQDGAVRIGLGKFNVDQDVSEAGELIAAALNAAEPSRRYA